MPPHAPLLRLFLVLPPDVAEERAIILREVERLVTTRASGVRVAIDVMTWEKPGADSAAPVNLMLAEAATQNLIRPSQCDMVVAVFWSQIGTPFTDISGKTWLSTTHWLVMDALRVAHPHLYIYRRDQGRQFELEDGEGRRQFRVVRAFFEASVFQPGGQFQHLVTTYQQPSEFVELFSADLEHGTSALLEKTGTSPFAVTGTTTVNPPPKYGSRIEPMLWVGSPYRRLEPFTEAHALIFFGREREIDQLVERVRDSRFVTVVGASGSGKSSLIRAGLIPRLRGNAVHTQYTVSGDWFIVRVVPGSLSNPFESLAAALLESLPALRRDDGKGHDDRLQWLAHKLQSAPDRLRQIISKALSDERASAEVLLFIDQFEELLIHDEGKPREARVANAFATMLSDAITHPNIRIVAAMRHDFFPKAVENPTLDMLLRNGTFTLSTPSREALRRMIEGPARIAGLTFADGLVDSILDDTGAEPGNLALMEYAIDELFILVERRANRVVTFADYNALGGVRGAIGKRAEAVFSALPGDESSKMQALQQVFHRLVLVDDTGKAVRQRAPFRRVTGGLLAEALVKAFIAPSARLLVSDTDTGSNGREPVLEVAHEALLRQEGWPRLAEWIARVEENLILVRQIKGAAATWHKQVSSAHSDEERKRRDKANRWSAEKLKEVERLDPMFKADFDPVVLAFLEPTANVLLRELEDINVSHTRRLQIGEQLAEIGDPRAGIGVDERGDPHIDWCLVSPGGRIEVQKARFSIMPFYIARYPITYAQFLAFAAKAETYNDERWWVGMPDRYKYQPATGLRNPQGNLPRATVSWYLAVAFCRWLNHRMQGITIGKGADTLTIGHMAEIRLPTEWEWQWAAQNGAEGRKYPWGAWDDLPRANTTEAGINDRSTAVGMYPGGMAACGAYDMAGNVWEWCQNKSEALTEYAVDGSGDPRSLRGGSFYSSRYLAACDARYKDLPDLMYNNAGFRIVAAVRL